MAQLARIEGQITVNILVDGQGTVACVYFIRGHLNRKYMNEPAGTAREFCDHCEQCERKGVQRYLWLKHGCPELDARIRKRYGSVASWRNNLVAMSAPEWTVGCRTGNEHGCEIYGRTKPGGPLKHYIPMKADKPGCTST